ncbi:MAG: hypothetical protein CME69_04595 [Halobacteriovorax sp.]|nr:hypothetical protein [Halobacteriovorax sp.]
MTSDLLKNINFISILSREITHSSNDTLNIGNHLLKERECEEFKMHKVYSLGVHPWDTYDFSGPQDSLRIKLKSLIQDPSCLAIGETGLDKLKGPSLDIQKEVFLTHIALSEELQKPIIIHCVRSYSEILEIYNKKKPKMPWILHDFNHNEHFVKSVIDKNIYFSLGTNFFMRENSKVVKAIDKIPIDRILFETDEMNVDVSELYYKYAKRMKLQLHDVQKRIKENFKRVFLRD